MSKRALFFVGFIVVIGYIIYRKSKAIVIQTVSDPALSEVMPPDPDLH